MVLAIFAGHLLSPVLASQQLWIAQSNPNIAAATQALTDLGEAKIEVKWETIMMFQNLELEGTQTQMFSPLRTARAFALHNVASSDTLTLAQAIPNSIDVNIAVAAAIENVQLYLHPISPNFRDAAKQIFQKVFKSSLSSAKSKMLSKWIGANIGRQVVAWGRSDRANHQKIPEYPAMAEGVWVLPNLRPAIEPEWGVVRAIGMDNLPQALPPPEWTSEAFQKDRESFWATQKSITDYDRQIAIKWAGDMGTISPPGLWQEAALELLNARGDLSPVQRIQILTTMDVAMHDAFITCWTAKYFYYVERPNQWVVGFDKNWAPLVRTPRFPSYPSGHSTISAAAATVLSHYFPENKDSWNDLALEASNSRIVGGIHWTIDAMEGLRLGEKVASELLFFRGN